MLRTETEASTFIEQFCQDRRSRTRFPLRGADFALKSADSNLPAHLVEYNDSGARLVVKDNLKPGQEIDVTLASSRVCFEGTARIAWRQELTSDAYVVGIEYLEIMEVQKCA